MLKNKRKSSSGANWMDTYGDMVTLLLCFFVLLFAMSTLDQQKWEMIVKSFNPDAIPEITIEKGNDGPIVDPMPQDDLSMDQLEVEQSIEELFQDLQEYIQQQGAQESISATKGEGFVFLSLNDAVFFNGDSYVLREDGKAVLIDVGTILGKASNAIDELRVLGHTAQAQEHVRNAPMTDRMLSTNRANAVLTYLQTVEGFTLDPARMLSIGYGQWRPISPNTDELRYKNRRVEFIITGKNVEDNMSDSIVKYYTTSETTPPPGSFDSILPILEHHYDTGANGAADTPTAPAPEPPEVPGEGGHSEDALTPAASITPH